MKALNFAVSVLRLDPYLKASQLLQLLIYCVNDDQTINAQYVSNFGRRCDFFYAKILMQ